MVASALVTAAGLAYVGRRYFYKKARKWASRNRNKIAAGVATLAMSYRGKRKRSVSRGRSRTRSHVYKKRRVDSVDSGYESYPRLHAKSFVKPRSLSAPARSKGVQPYRMSRSRYGSKDRRAEGETIVTAAGGVYSGKINRGMHKRRSWKEKFNKYGVVNKNEVTGTFSDDNCVYAVCDIIAPTDSIYYIIGAILRRLFEKAGFRPGGFDESPFGTRVLGTEMGNMEVVLTTLNHVTGAYSAVHAGISNSSSFADIIALLIPTFQDYVAQFGISSGSNTLDLVHISLEKYVTVALDPVSFVLSTLQLGELELICYGEADLKVQNRTPSSSGSTDANNITANPISGKSYVFNGVPKFKSYANVIGQTLPDNVSFNSLYVGTGLNLFGATNAIAANSFKTPPEPGAFWNCISSGNVKLDPGNVKILSYHYYKKMNVLRFLQKLKLNVNTSYYAYTIFPCLMVSFEDMINLENSNDVTIGVSVERYLGMMVTERHKKWMKSNFSTQHS